MLQTVIGIALGIVLAVLILRFLTGILKVGLVLIALGAVAGIAIYFLDEKQVELVGYGIAGLGFIFIVFIIMPVILGIMLLALPFLREHYTDKPSLLIQSDMSWLSHMKLLYSYYHMKGLVGIISIFIVSVISIAIFGNAPQK